MGGGVGIGVVFVLVVVIVLVVVDVVVDTWNAVGGGVSGIGVTRTVG